MEFMLFRKLLPLCAFFAFFSALPARAQLALYGTVDGVRFTGYTCQAEGGACASSGGIARPYGGNFGAFYDFRNVGPVRLGLDLRGDIFSTNKSAVEYQGGAGINKFYGALGGVRGSVAIPVTFLHPYAEVLAGYNRNNAASSYVGSYATAVPTNVELYSNYAQVQGLVGLDITVLPYLDIRAIEVGAGALFGPSTHSNESIGAGIVFHLPR